MLNLEVHEPSLEAVCVCVCVCVGVGVGWGWGMAHRICVALCFGSSNHFTGLIVI